MNIHRVIAGGLLILSTLATAETQTYQYPRADSLPEDDTSVFPRDPTLLTGHDINLTAERFFHAWSNKGNERERIKADMYFLGVLDATEGVGWCEYKKILPGSAHEYVFSRLAKLNPEQRKQRAATFIMDSMAEILPCGKDSKK
ncbi:hypothetical protein FJU30_17255 [Affinibrenneria salicis]|uniref:Rap1a immunity protein domain-containing protein n=1 Tax=Affinibrenneria salicis TaxID=2590031 RepID=A0A5J5FX71_9GAMM|nr:Rap1a/Tai family immunity protein [Affinibrenneria salicis]KAA8998161.1 hypothetical protein FJU30_17255 [Affinibrenneria salicis]